MNRAGHHIRGAWRRRFLLFDLVVCLAMLDLGLGAHITDSVARPFAFLAALSCVALACGIAVTRRATLASHIARGFGFGCSAVVFLSVSGGFFWMETQPPVGTLALGFAAITANRTALHVRRAMRWQRR